MAHALRRSLSEAGERAADLGGDARHRGEQILRGARNTSRKALKKHGKKALMASLDVNRPAAQEQLKVLGEQVQVATLPIVIGQQPVDIARRALEAARLQNVDVLMLDTAGRLHVDQALMDEMKAVWRRYLQWMESREIALLPGNASYFTGNANHTRPSLRRPSRSSGFTRN